MIQSVLEVLGLVGVLSVSFVLEAKSLIRLNEYFTVQSQKYIVFKMLNLPIICNAQCAHIAKNQNRSMKKSLD